VVRVQASAAAAPPSMPAPAWVVRKGAIALQAPGSDFAARLAREPATAGLLEAR
jgi:hypothetical protein